MRVANVSLARTQSGQHLSVRAKFPEPQNAESAVSDLAPSRPKGTLSQVRHRALGAQAIEKSKTQLPVLTTRRHSSRQHIQGCDRVIPIQARIGDALAVLQLGHIILAWCELLSTTMNVAFNHHAKHLV